MGNGKIKSNSKLALFWTNRICVFDKVMCYLSLKFRLNPCESPFECFSMVFTLLHLLLCVSLMKLLGDFADFEIAS